MLIVSKQTRYETEVSSLELKNNDFISKSQPNNKKLLQREISRRGLNYNQLSQSYDSHVQSVNDIVVELKKNNIEYTIVTATKEGKNDFPESYLNYDAIIAAGGDGTFLKAASEIYTLDVPLIGINTDPNKSKGALCTMHSSKHFDKYLEQILCGDFEWREHSRLRVQLEQGSQVDESVNSRDSKWTKLKRVALNEIFFAERNVAHPIQHELIVDQLDESADVQLSSGILICTGTGSSAWMANASKIDTDIVRQVLNMTRSIDSKSAKCIDLIDDTTMDQIADALSTKTHFDIGSSEIQYFVREVVSNGLRPPCKNKRGLHKSVTIRSRGWDPTMTLDGIHTYPLPAGQRAHFDTDPSIALRTLTFSNSFENGKG